MHSIVFLDRATIGPGVEIRKPAIAHSWVEYQSTAHAAVLDRLRGATIAVTNKVPLGREQLSQLPDLKMIAVAATGYDLIDMEYCRERGILVSNVRGYAVNTVPEHVLAMMLALRRSLIGYRQDVIAGEWQRAGQFCFFNHPITDLAGSTLGIVGGGTLGRALARLGSAIGMKVQFAEHKGRCEVRQGYLPFQQFLESSDVISLHCPLNEQTRNLIARDELQQMKSSAVLINAGRGGLVNEADLVEAIQNDWIAGAGFDCLSAEPISDDHPFHAILSRPNVIVTPHVAWASNDAMQILWNQLISHIENFAAGTPTNLI